MVVEPQEYFNAEVDIKIKIMRAEPPTTNQSENVFKNAYFWFSKGYNI